MGFIHGNREVLAVTTKMRYSTSRPLERLGRAIRDALIGAPRIGLLNYLKVRWLVSRAFYRQHHGRRLVRIRLPDACGSFVFRVGGSDPFVVYNSLVRQEYDTLPCRTGPEVVVDLGANIGASSVFFLERNRDCRVIAVECDPENFAICRRNLEQYGDRVVTVPAAVWPRSGERLVIERGTFRDGLEWATRVCASNGQNASHVNTISILDLMNRHEIDRIDCLKIDIEGSEADLFRENTGWLDKVGNLAIELHGGECESAFEAAMSKYEYETRIAGEYTFCLGIRPKRDPSY